MTPATATARSTRSTARAASRSARRRRPRGAPQAARAPPRRRRRAARARASTAADHPWARAQVGRASAIAGWLLLSLVLFLVSAQIQEGVSRRDRARAVEQAATSSPARRSWCSAPTCARATRSTSRQRARAAPTRSCSSTPRFGSVRKLSIPRDVEVDIPGHGINKINAAYAFGGPALTIETVEAFLGNGLEINHLVEVDFEDFPEFIDALGGVTVEQQDAHLLAAVRQLLEGPPLQEGRERPERPRGARLRPRAQEQLRARPRTTATAPPASSRCWARSASQVKSPSTFFRLPVGELERAATLRTRHERLPADGAVRRHGDRQLGRDRGARGHLLPRQQPVRLGRREARTPSEAARGRASRTRAGARRCFEVDDESAARVLRRARARSPTSPELRVRLRSSESRGRPPSDLPSAAAPDFFLP